MKWPSLWKCSSLAEAAGKVDRMGVVERNQRLLHQSGHLALKAITLPAEQNASVRLCGHVAAHAGQGAPAQIGIVDGLRRFTALMRGVYFAAIRIQADDAAEQAEVRLAGAQLGELEAGAAAMRGRPAEGCRGGRISAAPA